jgi:hypothetical protein
MKNKFLIYRLKQIYHYPVLFFILLKRHFWDKWHSFKYNKNFKTFKQLNEVETLKYIIENNISIMRFGDGEFGLLYGMSIFSHIKSWNDFTWSQVYSKEIKNEMKRLLSLKNPKILIAIPPFWQILHNDKQFEQFSGIEKIYSNMHIEARMFLWKFLSSNILYGSWSVFMPQHHINLNWNLVKKYFENRNIVIVTGDTYKLKNITFSEKTFFIEAGKYNMFEKRFEVFQGIQKSIVENKFKKENTLFLVSLGPTACSVVEYISNLGFTAWDTGHFFQLAEKEIKKELF